MNMKIAILTLFLIGMSNSNFFSSHENLSTNHYAVLVAGSNGFWNYRHQSDVFHAYHLLIKNGMPKENIIVFAFDDIANDPQNPFKGQVFNKPDPTGKGQDVYQGVQIDYKGKDVIPQNFLDVLEGNADKMKGKGTGKVLTSGENDYVFINFSDHGATGLIAFPSGELYADQLINTFKKMNEKKMYKKLVFYLEACESGSMFDKVLPNDISIYASSAANPTESSWATYCSPNDIVNGKHIQSCLGDEYSVNWMEDSDAAIEGETISTQFTNVKSKVKGSSPMEWGDQSFENSFKVTDFQGTTDESERKGFSLEKLFNKLINKAEKYMSQEKKNNEYQVYLDIAKESRLDSREVKLHYLYEKLYLSNDEQSRSELDAELQQREIIDNFFMNFTIKLNLNVLQNKNEFILFDCLRNSIETYKAQCGNWTEYTLKYAKTFNVACLKYTETEVQNTIMALCP